MRIILFALTIIVLTAGYSINTIAQDAVLYVGATEECDSNPAGENSSLYLVNPQDATSSLIGPVGFNGLTSLAILGDGRLVGTANMDDGSRTAVLIEINPITGQGTLIGVIGNENNPGECGRVPGITYDPTTNTLYGVVRNCNFPGGPNFLGAINQNNGQLTIIGDIDSPGAGNGLAIRDDGTLFWAANGPGPARINTVDQTNAMITNSVVLSQDEALPNALAFHPASQQLYMTNREPVDPFSFPESTLDIINTTTGELTVVGQLPNCSNGLIFVPTPRNVPTLSQWGLMAMTLVLGIVGFIVIRRRQSIA
ncbi:MAG: IPTL-CTERM sorting domain-containing protein [Thermodesulfobacteriota bacterium]